MITRVYYNGLIERWYRVLNRNYDLHDSEKTYKRILWNRDVKYKLIIIIIVLDFRNNSRLNETLVVWKSGAKFKNYLLIYNEISIRKYNNTILIDSWFVQSAFEWNAIVTNKLFFNIFGDQYCIVRVLFSLLVLSWIHWRGR